MDRLQGELQALFEREAVLAGEEPDDPAGIGFVRCPWSSRDPTIQFGLQFVLKFVFHDFSLLSQQLGVKKQERKLEEAVAMLPSMQKDAAVKMDAIFANPSRDETVKLSEHRRVRQACGGPLFVAGSSA